MILIDDDALINYINQKAVEKAAEFTMLKTFISPKAALRFLSTEEIINLEDRVFIFLDVRMPEMDGFAFLDTFLEFPDEVKSKITVVMLSSTIDPLKKQKAMQHELVLDFYDKPLDEKIFQDLLTKL